MSEKMIENNKVSVIGEIISGFTFSHEVFGEGFYMVDVAVNRLSEQADVIPLMISERLIDVEANYIGCTMEALGQFRSYNRHEGTKNRLVLSILYLSIRYGSRPSKAVLNPFLIALDIPLNFFGFLSLRAA